MVTTFCVVLAMTSCSTVLQGCDSALQFWLLLWNMDHDNGEKKTISTDWTRVFFESSNQISQEGYGYSTESDGDPYAGKQITEKEKSRCESTTRYYNVFKKPRLRSIAWWFLGPKKTMEGPRKDR